MSTIYMIITTSNNKSKIKPIAYRDKNLVNDIADNLKSTKQYDKVEVIEVDLKE